MLNIGHSPLALGKVEPLERIQTYAFTSQGIEQLLIPSVSLQHTPLASVLLGLLKLLILNFIL